MQKTVTVAAGGQVTLGKELLDHLGVVPGNEIVIDFLASAHAEIRSARNGKPISRFFGSLHKEGTVPLTIEEMNEIIADGRAGIHE